MEPVKVEDGHYRHFGYDIYRLSLGWAWGYGPRREDLGIFPGGEFPSTHLGDAGTLKACAVQIEERCTKSASVS